MTEPTEAAKTPGPAGPDTDRRPPAAAIDRAPRPASPAISMMDSVLTLVLGYVQSSARQALEATLVERRTGLTDDEWWAAQAPLLEQVIEPERFPVASRVGTAATEAHRGLWDPDHTFEFGLERVLDGIEALVEARRAGGSRERTAGSSRRTARGPQR